MTSLASVAAHEDTDVPPGHHVMHQLDHNGDTRIIWDPHNAEEVANAKATFEALTRKGFRAYSVKRNGDKGEVIKAFDPEAEKLILAPATVGG